jgi:outer membrane protein assembly factor BamB
MTSPKPLRLWPGVVAAVLTLLVKLLSLVVPGMEVWGILSGVAGALIVIVWWLFFSRAPWSERIGALIVMIVAAFATKFVVHPSIAGGLMGRMVYVYAVPTTLGPAFVAWAVATRRLSDGLRRATMVATILLACGVWMLIRTEGVKGEAVAQLKWRWTPTAEDRLLAQAKDEPDPIPPAPAAPENPTVSPAAKPEATSTAVPAAAAVPAPAVATADKPVRLAGDWPGFRGRERNGVVRGVRLETDWTKSQPVQLWKRPIGPGWSSFAVHGDLIYTQEQRGEHEVVSGYRLTTGEPVWRHRDAVRFYESNGGAGPRGTPTVHNGRVYTHGATGIVNALDAGNGAVVWSRNAQTDTGASMPGWGFTSSPLIVNDTVVVASSGRLVAYDLASGNPRWTRMTGGGGYSSPHLATLAGVPQILLLSGGGATSVAPADGAVLWQNTWQDGVGIVQPTVLGDDNVLIVGGDAMGGFGVRRLAVSHGSSGWTVQERWTTRGLKPYFNDYVVHKGHAFGFDGTILSCINLEDGERKWKGGRYGAGQMMLLPDQDLLLVLSEDGDLALVSATPDKFTEVAKFPAAIEGKTWNHPALLGNVLLVRNGEQMAAFRLTLASR